MIRNLLFPVLMLSASSAFGGFNFFLTDPIQSTPPGGLQDFTCQSGSGMCLIFSGTIDTVTSDTFFTGIDVEFAPSTTFLSHNPNFFGTFGPALLLTGDTFNGPIFEIDIQPFDIGDPIAPFGHYFGTVQFIGGVDPSHADPVLDLIGTPQSFAVNVVPEPAARSLMLIGLAALAVAAQKRLCRV